ncbi:MAG TPA: ABC transporter permease [Candidatus Polarisedimenticolia bacterium]|nr:ABC transporter permease [Candidatus Polarisedimenticolia bacterium]
MRFFLAAFTLWRREQTRFFRQGSRVFGAFAQPLIFWALFGSGLRSSFRPPVGSGQMEYMQYFFPGTVVLILLFTAIFSTISVIEDRKEGFLQGVLVAPVPRTALVLGKVLGGTTLAVLQGTLVLALAPLAGIHLGPASFAAGIAIQSLVAFALTALSFCIAWRMDSTQGFHAIMTVFLMPLWLLSGAFFPASGVPGWLGFLMKINPLTYGVAALRRVLYKGDPSVLGDLPRAGFCLAITALFAAVTFTLAVGLARRRGVEGR